MVPRYRIEVRSVEMGRFEVKLFTPVDDLVPFFSDIMTCASADEAYRLAEQALLQLTGQPVLPTNDVPGRPSG